MTETTLLKGEPETERVSKKASFANRALKRMFDMISALICSVILLVPMIVTAVIIMIKDFGNPFYKQKRVGLNGKPIYIYKFRSMKKGAENLEDMLTPEQIKIYKRDYKLDDDPRLIGYRKKGDGAKCFGIRLRRMSIDELPQIFINILILGNMSFIGPRPILEAELNENYTLSEQKLLLSVKPGLTGYWQAYARNDVGYEEHRRQDMELYYVKNQTVSLNIKILFKTIGTVLKKSGAK